MPHPTSYNHPICCESQHPRLVPYLRRKNNYLDVSCRFYKNIFYEIKGLPFTHKLLTVCHKKVVLNFVKCFSASSEKSCFVHLVMWVVFINIQMLNQLHISVINTLGWGEKKSVSEWKKKVLVTQSCLTLWDPKECCLPGSSVHEILQARKLQWVVSPFSGGSSWRGLNMGLPHCRQILYHLSHPFYILFNLICYI